MQETNFISISNNKALSSTFPNPPKPHFPLPPHHDFPSLSPHKTPKFPSLSSKTNTPLPPKPSPTPDLPSDFHRKILYLDSIGIDFLSVINSHPQIISTPLADLKSTVDFISSVGFTTLEFQRIVGMCPEILTSKLADIVPIFTFLIREAKINGSDLKRVINKRPRLLACSVKNRLRPTLYFLQTIGIAEVNKHTNLLTSSVEEKLIPRIEYFERIGFSRRESTAMFRRFPQLFCYSIESNFEPKFDYFVVEMGRDLKELKEFPQYFSFSLENRIKPRHQSCVEKGVCFPLPVLLKTKDAQFYDRLEVCCNSSMPVKASPLWVFFQQNLNIFPTFFQPHLPFLPQNPALQKSKPKNRAKETKREALKWLLQLHHCTMFLGFPLVPVDMKLKQLIGDWPECVIRMLCL